MEVIDAAGVVYAERFFEPGLDENVSAGRQRSRGSTNEQRSTSSEVVVSDGADRHAAR